MRKMVGCRRHPSAHGRGWADPRRRAAWLVACVLSPEYATLLAPGAAGASAQRGRGSFWEELSIRGAATALTSAGIACGSGVGLVGFKLTFEGMG